VLTALLLSHYAFSFLFFISFFHFLFFFIFVIPHRSSPAVVLSLANTHLSLIFGGLFPTIAFHY
jgi:hypothetical protein